MSILELTAVKLGRKIKAGEITAVEAAEASLAQMKALEPVLNCYVTIDEERVLKQAGEVQEQIERGILTGPLAGVPVAVKDNLCTEGLRTTCGSRILHNFIPAYTAEAVKNLERAGAVILGKTNMDEFAMGSTTETSAYGATKNPWNVEHVPGGSSGGSCAAVAANECFYALGSDTGGSIRQPGALCGVTGIKPTYGTVSRYGLVAYGSSLDQIGPIARDVTDCAVILEAVSSYDRKDSTSVARQDYDFTSALADDVRGMRIGIPRDYLGDGLDPEVKEAVLMAAKVLEGKGAVVEEFDLSLVEYAIPAYYVIASAEASSNLSRFDGVKYGYRAEEYDGLHSMYKKSRSEGFGAEVKRRIMLGSFVLSSGYYDAYYLKALRTKALARMTRYTEASLPVVAFLSFLIRSTALSFSPLRSHSAITGRVSTNSVAVRLVINAVPRISRIFIGESPATRPVTTPATTTVAIASNFSMNPMITTTTPISLSISIYRFLLHKI